MTIVGSGPQLSPTNTLREFTFTFFMDTSASDLRQVPAIGASVTVYKKGATANGSGSVAVAGSGAVSVHSPGQIKVGDAIFADLTTSIQATVTGVTTTGITFINVVGGSFTWSDGSRIRANTNRPTLYSDDHSGNTTTNPVTLDANGFAQCWAEPGVVDCIVSGGGIATAGYGDVTAQPLLSEVRRADEFPGADWGQKVANALADLNQTYGGVVDARGLIGNQTILTDPFTGVTWPFLLLVGPAVINTDVGLNPTSAAQRVVGLGPGISSLKASLSFPTSGRLYTMGPSTAGTVLGNVLLQGLTIDCNGMPSSVGVRCRALGSTCQIRDIRVRNAKQYGVEIASGVWNGTVGMVIRDSTIEITDTGGIGVYVDTNQQTDVVDTIFTSTVVGAAAIRKNSVLYARYTNIQTYGSGFTSIIRLSAEGQGGAALTDIAGCTGTTNVVLVDTAVNDYTIRNLILGGSTNSLVDTDRALTITTDIIEFTSGITYRYETGGTTSRASGSTVSQNVDPTSATPTYTLVVPAGATATQYAFSETVNAVQKFGLRKDGWVAVERLLSTFGTAIVAGDVAIGGAAGTGPSVTIGAGSTDFCGRISMNVGTGSPGAWTATLTFKTPFTATPVACFVSPATTTGVFDADEYIYVSALTTTTVTFSYHNIAIPTPSSTYSFYYLVIGK